MGETVVIRLDPKHGFASVGGTLDASDDAAGPRTLRLAVAQNAEASQIRDAAQAWLMRQARRLFIERLDHFAPRLGCGGRSCRCRMPRLAGEARARMGRSG